MMASLFIIYICALPDEPDLGPRLAAEERDIPQREKLRLLRAGLLPLASLQ